MRMMRIFTVIRCVVIRLRVLQVYQMWSITIQMLSIPACCAAAPGAIRSRRAGRLPRLVQSDGYETATSVFVVRGL